MCLIEAAWWVAIRSNRTPEKQSVGGETGFCAGASRQIINGTTQLHLSDGSAGGRPNANGAGRCLGAGVLAKPTAGLCEGAMRPDKNRPLLAEPCPTAVLVNRGRHPCLMDSALEIRDVPHTPPSRLLA